MGDEEIHNIGSSGVAYSPELEWPGNAAPGSSVSYNTTQSELALTASESPYLCSNSSSPPLPRVHLDTSCLRLLVQQSTILARKQTLAVLDGYKEAHIGRDAAPSGSKTPRIRLKEMEVSKLHATIFWDRGRREWAIVDMGSKHGTFLRSHRGPKAPTSEEASGQAVTHVTSPIRDEGAIRLSAPRKASMPRQLNHLDTLSVGGTMFIVHIHGQMPCIECSPSADNEIPLFNRQTGDRNAEAAKKRKRDVTERQMSESSHLTSTRDSKRALNDLRRDLLSRHVTPQTPAAPSQYTDRSALRRARRPDAAPVVSPSPAHMQSASISAVQDPTPPAPVPPISALPAPLPDSNVGHRMLMKQGWSPGESLGCASSSDVALVEPLNIKANQGKTGLGSAIRDITPSPTVPGIDWKEAGKLRQWNSVRAIDSSGPP